MLPTYLLTYLRLKKNKIKTPSKWLITSYKSDLNTEIEGLGNGIKHQLKKCYTFVRMDPRVGSGHNFAGFWRVGSALRILYLFTGYFLVPESI